MSGETLREIVAEMRAAIKHGQHFTDLTRWADRIERASGKGGSELRGP